MARRKEEKERLRKARLEAEKREASDAQRRLMLGYGVAGLLAAVVLVGLVIVIAKGGGGGGGKDSGPENAHINPTVGTPPEGVDPDGREGTTPPAIQQADLQEAAKVAKCDLRLDLPDEGNSHLKPSEDPPDYKTNLRELAQNAPTYGNYRVSILGFADPRGDAEANERLSLKRAAAVSNYLRQTGAIQPGRVLSPSAMGEGTVAPGETAPTSDDEARRVVVRIVTPKGQLTQ